MSLLLLFAGVPSQNYSLAAAQGSFVLTGEAAKLLAGRLVSAQEGAFSLTGEPLQLIATRHLNMAPGSFVFTGEAAQLVFSNGLSYRFVQMINLSLRAGYLAGVKLE